MYERIASLSTLQDINKLRNAAQELLEITAKGTPVDAEISSNASILYRRIISISNYQDTDQLKNIAQDLLNIGENRNASIIYEGILSKLEDVENASNGSKAEAQLNYGISLMRLDNNDDAIKALEKSIEYGANKFYTYNYLCQLYQKIGQLEDALTSCHNALNFDPGEDKLTRAKIWYSRGLVLSDKELDSDSLESYLFAYSILSIGKDNQVIRKLEGEELSSSGTNGRISEDERIRLKNTLNSIGEADLDKLLKDEMSRYNSYLTKNLLSLVASSKTLEGIPVVSGQTDMTGNLDVDELILADDDSPESLKVVVSVSDFPQRDCGDFYNKQSEGNSSFLYPVSIKYNREDALVVEEEFCEETWKRPDGRLQVGSFKDRSVAEDIKNILEERFDDVSVGEPNDTEES